VSALDVAQYSVDHFAHDVLAKPARIKRKTTVYTSATLDGSIAAEDPCLVIVPRWQDTDTHLFFPLGFRVRSSFHGFPPANMHYVGMFPGEPFDLTQSS